MANDYFRFKQFTIHQDRCAMKVSTDACLLGAIAPFADHTQHILDIGTGTGLLALMLAQRFPHAQIDAVEMDASAAKQAQENVAISPWANRIAIYQADVLSWEREQQYDTIICNPPFFNNHLRSSAPARNAARHDDNLSKENLAAVLKQRLTPNGVAVVLFPFQEQEKWAVAANKQALQLTGTWQLKPNKNKPCNRVISAWSKAPTADPTIAEILIYEAPQSLSQGAAELLKDFYLFL